MLADAEESATPAYDIDGSDRTHGDPHTVRSKDPRAVATDPHPTRGSGVNSSFSNGVRYGRTVPFIVRKGIANSRQGNLGPSSEHGRPGSSRHEARNRGELREAGAADRTTRSRGRDGVGAPKSPPRRDCNKLNKLTGREELRANVRSR